MSAPVDTFLGVAIYHDAEDGYHASAGCAVHFGYCDTLDAIREEIGDHFEEERAHYAGIDTPPDTPCLDTYFHDLELI